MHRFDLGDAGARAAQTGNIEVHGERLHCRDEPPREVYSTVERNDLIGHTDTRMYRKQVPPVNFLFAQEATIRQQR